MEFPEPNDKLIRLLLPRLERISVDSYWAHRASGVRGALVRLLAQMELGEIVDPVVLQRNIQVGFDILQKAAEEYQFSLFRNDNIEETKQEYQIDTPVFIPESKSML